LDKERSAAATWSSHSGGTDDEGAPKPNFQEVARELLLQLEWWTGLRRIEIKRSKVMAKEISFVFTFSNF
jgi:hypothetical protein